MLDSKISKLVARKGEDTPLLPFWVWPKVIEAARAGQRKGKGKSRPLDSWRKLKRLAEEKRWVRDRMKVLLVENNTKKKQMSAAQAQLQALEESSGRLATDGFGTYSVNTLERKFF